MKLIKENHYKLANFEEAKIVLIIRNELLKSNPSDFKQLAYLESTFKTYELAR